MATLRDWFARAIDLLQGHAPEVRRPQRIFFIHIAKTAGTSMRRMLEREFGARLVYPGSHHLRLLPEANYPHGSEILRDFARLPPHNVLTGHVTAAMADMLPRPYRTATIVRDPIQRSLSMLGHFSRNLKVPVEQLSEDRHFIRFNIADFQTRVLGADGVCDPHLVGPADRPMLERATRRLETLDFVGLTERFEESCSAFDARFGTNVSKSVRRDLVRRPDGTELAEFIPCIAPYLEHDRVLYERARAAFLPSA